MILFLIFLILVAIIAASSQSDGTCSTNKSKNNFGIKEKVAIFAAFKPFDRRARLAMMRAFFMSGRCMLQAALYPRGVA